MGLKNWYIPLLEGYAGHVGWYAEILTLELCDVFDTASRIHIIWYSWRAFTSCHDTSNNSLYVFPTEEWVNVGEPVHKTGRSK